MARFAREETVKVSVKSLGKLAHSRRGLAIPVTYLLLFASLIVIVSATYGFAIARISAEAAQFRVSVAKRNMQALDEAIRFVAWSAGGSKTVYMEDCGSLFHSRPLAKNLTIVLTDNQAFSHVVFNGSVGKVLYALEGLAESNVGLFVRGDSRTIVGQGAYPVTQLYFAFDKEGEAAQQLVLCYRPMATVLAVGANGEAKPLNIIRVYIISLGCSRNFSLYGSFRLKVSVLHVTSAVMRFEFNSSVSSLALEAVSDNAKTTVWLPVQSGAEGALVSIETYVCYVKLEAVNP
ncbi:MAG: hypothetical protein QXH20_07425 [Candidatus Bathyarchaeia archaeon]